ncbi:MAG: ParB/RepB/Spo0J family partition protein [Acidimicrobiia bacterium]
MSGQRRIEDLRIYSFNREIYGEPDAELADSLASFGLQHPIQITPDGGILSGARRWAAADALHWKTIATEVPDIDFGDGVAIQKFILLANRYRTSKNNYTQKKEADGYLKLLSIGELTKDDLREAARNKGSVAPDRRHADGRNHEAKPTRLAARAAGLSPRTYDRYRHVDDGGAAEDIVAALEAGAIKPQQASDLKRHLHEDQAKLRKGAAPDTIDGKVRERLEAAKVTDEERKDQEAEEVVEARVHMNNVIAFVDSL